MDFAHAIRTILWDVMLQYWEELSLLMQDIKSTGVEGCLSG